MKQNKKAKEVKESLPKSIRPKITEFEMNMLPEYIQDRFGLKSKVYFIKIFIDRIPTHQLLISNFNSEENMEKKLKPNVEQLDPDLKMSFASDRNPYFLDFNKSMRNHSHDIINRLSNKDKFKRKNKQWEMIRMKSKNNDNMTLKPVQPKVLPQKLSLSESVSSLNLTKCNNIIND